MTFVLPVNSANSLPNMDTKACIVCVQFWASRVEFSLDIISHCVICALL